MTQRTFTSNLQRQNMSGELLTEIMAMLDVLVAKTTKSYHFSCFLLSDFLRSFIHKLLGNLSPAVWFTNPMKWLLIIFSALIAAEGKIAITFHFSSGLVKMSFSSLYRPKFTQSIQSNCWGKVFLFPAQTVLQSVEGHPVSAFYETKSIGRSTHSPLGLRIIIRK